MAAGRPSRLAHDRTVEIERIAALDTLNYDVAREAMAKHLGIRTSTL